MDPTRPWGPSATSATLSSSSSPVSGWGGAESAISALGGIAELALGGPSSWISYGVEMLLSYVDPLKFWMDQLAGDSAQVNGMAMTWASIGDSLRSTATELDSRSSSAMQDMKGESVTRYLARQRQVINSVNTLADASAAVGRAVAKAAELVQKVHDYVCKLISDIIGEAAEGVALAGFTLGFRSSKQGLLSALVLLLRGRTFRTC